MIRKSSPSIWISVPAYLPYRTVSPIFTVTGSSFLPGPAATTVPRCGFSLAVSGMIMPPAVFSSAGAGFTITLSASGVTFNFLPIVVLFYWFYLKDFRMKSSDGEVRRILYQTLKQGHFYRICHFFITKNPASWRGFINNCQKGYFWTTWDSTE